MTLTALKTTSMLLMFLPSIIFCFRSSCSSSSVTRIFFFTSARLGSKVDFNEGDIGAIFCKKLHKNHSSSKLSNIEVRIRTKKNAFELNKLGYISGGARVCGAWANVRLATPPCPRSQLTRECGELPSVRMWRSPGQR